MQNTVHIHKTN